MTVTLILPMVPPWPIGGFKVMYEYANQLSRRGYHVRVVHPIALVSPHSVLDGVRWLRHHLLAARGYLSSPAAHWKDRRDLLPWFPFEREVQVYCVPDLSKRFIPPSQVLITTGWQTIPWIDKYDESKGRRYFLIHDYEYYKSADRRTRLRMEAAFRADLCKIVTSPAGTEMLEECGTRPDAYIPNGVDTAPRPGDLAVEDPARSWIGFPTRSEPFKGTSDAVRALEAVREQVGDGCTIWSFGGKRPSYLPGWVTYHERPSDDELHALYNRTSIFVVPSHYEGWGLPGAEAMACGAALVSTDNGGVRAYATHPETALLSPPREPRALADNVLLLLGDSARRLGLARRGHAAIQAFTWSSATDALEGLLRQRPERLSYTQGNGSR